MKKPPPIVLKALGYVLFAATAAALLMAPWFYFKYQSPITSDESTAIVCRNENAEDHEPSDVREILSGKKKAGDKVKLYGTLSYAPGEEVFYLRDGMYNLPLSLRDCQNIEPLKEAEVRVFMLGRVAETDGEPSLKTDGFNTDLPVWVKNIFNAGVYGVFIIFGLLLSGMLFLFRKFLEVIGFARAKKTPLTPDESRAQAAGRSILGGITSPFFWVMNPILGAGSHVKGIVAGIRGLRSKKRTVAIVGLTLCAAGLVVTPLVLGAFGVFSKAGQPDFAGWLTEVSFRDAEEIEEDMGPPEPLESEPYSNEKLGFRMRLPRGWYADESGKYAPLVFFAPAPDVDSAGKDFTSNIMVNSGPAGKDTPETVIAALKDNAKKGKGYVKNEDGLLKDGDRTIGIILGYTYPDENIGSLQLFYFVTGKDPIYLFTVTTLASTWSNYEKVIKDSFATFESIPVKPAE